MLMQTDVCIVGAGPAGLTLANAMAGHGFDVILLEAGSSDPPVGGEDVTSTESVGLEYDLAWSRAQGLGGSSLRWNIETPVGERHLRLRELDAIDFEVRQGVQRSGWPFGKAQLDPHYEEAWQLFGLRRPDGDRSFGETLECRVLSFGPSATFVHRLAGAVSDHPRVRLLTSTSAVDIRTDEDPGRVSAIRCRTNDGEAFEVRASSFVLAGGGIENARVLLASRSTSPAGLGNHHDQVGRYFMEHPHYLAGVLRGRIRPLPEWGMVATDGQTYETRFGLNPELVAAEGLLDGLFQVYPQPVKRPIVTNPDGTLDQHAMDLLERLELKAGVGGGPPVTRADIMYLGRRGPALTFETVKQILAYLAARRGKVARTGRTFAIEAMAEQEPRAESRVRINDNKLDAVGAPMGELDWQLSALDASSIVRTTELVGQGLAAALGGRFHSTLPRDGIPKVTGGWHHMGTTRMSTSPQHGVVDVDGKVHGVGNLYVAGSSVFPTSGYANPTLTIVALTLRLGQHLAKVLKGGSVREPGPAER